MGSAWGVITSYSIHYTKLYENVFSRKDFFTRNLQFGADQVEVVVQQNVDIQRSVRELGHVARPSMAVLEIVQKVLEIEWANVRCDTCHQVDEITAVEPYSYNFV